MMIKYKCPKCGATLESLSSMAGQQDQCPLCRNMCLVPARERTNRRAILGRMTQQGPDKLPLLRKKHLALFFVGLIAIIVAQSLGIRNPSAYTAAALLVMVMIRPITYFIILGVVALVGTAITRTVRRYWFAILAWLFLFAGVFDIAVNGYREFVLRPRVDKLVEELVRNGTLGLEPSRRQVPESQRTKLTGRYGTYSIEYDDSKWQYAPETEGDEEFSFDHRDGDVFAMIVAERLSIPRKTFRDMVVGNLRSVATQFRVLREERKTVGGQSVLCLTMSGAIDGVPLVFHGYYYTGKAGTIQVVTYTGQRLFDQYVDDMTEFLDGLRIVTAPSTRARPQEALLGHWVTSDDLIHYYYGPNKMTVVYPGQPGRELAYSVLRSSQNSVTLRMLGGNMPHTRRFVFHDNGRATQTMKLGRVESKYELKFVDKKQSP